MEGRLEVIEPATRRRPCDAFPLWRIRAFAEIYSDSMRSSLRCSKCRDPDQYWEHATRRSGFRGPNS